jgi:hypothetical protein
MTHGFEGALSWPKPKNEAGRSAKVMQQALGLSGTGRSSEDVYLRWHRILSWGFDSLLVFVIVHFQRIEARWICGPGKLRYTGNREEKRERLILGWYFARSSR